MIHSYRDKYINKKSKDKGFEIKCIGFGDYHDDHGGVYIGRKEDSKIISNASFLIHRMT